MLGAALTVLCLGLLATCAVRRRPRRARQPAAGAERGIAGVSATAALSAHRAGAAAAESGGRMLWRASPALAPPVRAAPPAAPTVRVSQATLLPPSDPPRATYLPLNTRRPPPSYYASVRRPAEPAYPAPYPGEPQFMSGHEAASGGAHPTDARPAAETQYTIPETSGASYIPTANASYTIASACDLIEEGLSSIEETLHLLALSLSFGATPLLSTEPPRSSPETGPGVPQSTDATTTPAATAGATYPAEDPSPTLDRLSRIEETLHLIAQTLSIPETPSPAGAAPRSTAETAGETTPTAGAHRSADDPRDPTWEGQFSTMDYAQTRFLIAERPFCEMETSQSFEEMHSSPTTPTPTPTLAAGPAGPAAAAAAAQDATNSTPPPAASAPAGR